MKNIWIATLLLVVGCGDAPSRLKVKASQKSGGDATAGSDSKDLGSDTENKSEDKKSQKEVVETILRPETKCEGVKLQSRPILRLLTRDEYQNTVRDVLKVAVDYRAGLPVEIGKAGFKNNADAGTLSDAHVNSYLNSAIQIAEEIKPNLMGLIACNQETAACAKTLIEKLGPSLWRRPLEASELKELTDLFAAAPADSDKLSVLIARLLTSPAFLYRSELGKAGKLTSYEMASALSYYFWGTVPDAELLQHAKSGAILEDKTLVAQAERLLADNRAKFLTEAFSDAWLGPKKILSFNKSAEAFPVWNAELSKMLVDEAIGTFDAFSRDGSKTYKDLLTSNYSLGSAKLASFYGSTASMDGGLNRLTHSSTPRRGILGLGAVLAGLASAAESHPFKRGGFVLEHLYCHIPDPTPEGAIFQPPAIDKSLLTRERFAQHSSAPQCKGCHLKIDNIGFGMEDFDGIGAYRTKENGKTIDASGKVIGLEANDVEFRGTAELSAKIAESDRAKRCYTVQWLRMAKGYLESSGDICSVKAIADTFAADKMSLRDLILQSITNPAFRARGE